MLSADANAIHNPTPRGGRDDNGPYNGDWPTHDDGTVWSGATCSNDTGGTDDRVSVSINSNRGGEDGHRKYQDQERTHERLLGLEGPIAFVATPDRR
jgi:hypothetical protein